MDAPGVELPAPEIPKPVEAAPAPADADDRVGHAVVELKEILALLSRSEP